MRKNEAEALDVCCGVRGPLATIVRKGNIEVVVK